MNISIDQQDFGTLCICAIRYCHGRQTYMPSLVQRIVGGHIKEISDKDLAVMLSDCEFQEQIPSMYGDEKIDKPGWLAWKKRIEQERKERE